jgi:hypothetical protein
LYHRGKAWTREPMTLPESEWEAIDERTRQGYLEGNLGAVEEWKRAHPPSAAREAAPPLPVAPTD